MISGRFFLLFISLFSLILIASSQTVEAFWGFGENKSVEKSGLDLDGGYDRNTVTTISGKVATLKFDEEHPPNMVVVQDNGALIHLVVGPYGYWADNGIALKVGDDVTARGSKAQGKDGNTYLLVQRLKNSSTGTEISLRDDSGHPIWRAGGRRDGGNQGGNSMNRNGGQMRRGGGRMGR